MGNATKLRSISDTNFLVKILNKSVGARISTLLFNRCPSAIAWLVVAVYVNPINAVTSTWLWPHVLVEGFKTVHPLTANSYTSAAVTFIVSGIWIAASISHANPCAVFGRLRHPMGFGPSAGQLPIEAPA